MRKTERITPAAPPASGPERRLLKRAEAASYLGVSQSTMARWAVDRTGPPFVKLQRAGAGSVRYPSDLLAAYLESRITLTHNT